MKNLFRKTLGPWTPDADPVNAPEGVSLRSDNMVPDPLAMRALRRGSNILYHGLAAQRFESLYTATPILSQVPVHFGGIDTAVYRNRFDTLGVETFEDFGVVFPDTDSDIAFGDDAYQVLMARSNMKRKFDGADFNKWGIDAPQYPAIVSAATAITFAIASFNGAAHASPESPAFTINEGTKADVTGHDAVANAAMQLTPNITTGRASVSKKFAADTDLLNIAGTAGSETDLFDIYVWIEEPKKTNKITIMFGLGSGTDPYTDDYYYFDFNIANPSTVDIKDSSSAVAAAYSVMVNRANQVLSIDEITTLKTPDEVTAILKRLGRFAGPRATERRDSLEASPAWTHLSVTRGQFNRVGGTSGKSWQTVRGFKVVYDTVPGTTNVLQLDSAVFVGGGNASLTGTFQVAYRYVRDFVDANGDLIYQELSPISALSNKITLSQQALSVQIPAEAFASADPQATGTWIYLYGGNLNTFYKIGSTGLTGGATLKIDEFKRTPIGSDFALRTDRRRLESHGLSIPHGAPLDDSGNNAVVLNVQTSELQALIENEMLEPGCSGPPDNIVAIAGPFNGRIFVLTADGRVYPSSMDSPSSFSLYQHLDLRRYGDPLWMVRTAGGIHVGMTKDVVRIDGTGDESEDRATADLSPTPLHVGNPPIDSSVYTDGNAVIYRSADGLMLLSGSNLTAITQGNTSLLWRGQDRHGIEALDTVSGRFRFVVDNQILYMLAPEGQHADPTAVWRYYLTKQEWARTTYPFTFLSLFRDPDGSILAGTDEGILCELEVGEQDEVLNSIGAITSQDIEVNILTVIDAGDNPLARKDACDFQIHADTRGNTGTAVFYLDGASNPTASFNFSCLTPGVHRTNVNSLGVLLKAQIQITGSFSKFVVHAFNLTYRDRVQQVMVLDTGTISAANNKDFVWLTECQIDCISPVNLSVDLFLDDVLKTTQSITVKPNKRSTYPVPLPRGCKAYAPRLVFYTTNPAGSSNPGFEAYSVLVKDRQTGTTSDNEFRPIWPLAQAP